MMYCTYCGKEVNENQEVCLNCGVRVHGAKNYCYNCGKERAENAEFCIGCGVGFKKNDAKNSNYLNGQDKMTLALICFFLGGIGIHNFMLGETKKGVIKIVFAFIFGLSGILALIDFIKILTDKYEVDPERYF